jgi:hypothetical protein
VHVPELTAACLVHFVGIALDPARIEQTILLAQRDGFDDVLALGRTVRHTEQHVLAGFAIQEFGDVFARRDRIAVDRVDDRARLDRDVVTVERAVLDHFDDFRSGTRVRLIEEHAE